MKPIDDYSPCCEMPVLPHRIVGPARRAKALAELRWEKRCEDHIALMWRNLQVAYARDVPDYRWTSDGCQIINVTFKWCSACSIASGLFGFFEDMEDYPGRDDFPTLQEAAEDLRAFLVAREGEKAIPKLPKRMKAQVPG